MKLNVVYLYKKSSPLNAFIERQLRDASFLDSYTLEKYTIEDCPVAVNNLDINVWHTLIFYSPFGDELMRLEGPFSTEQFYEALFKAKKIYADNSVVSFLL
ncbi:hypothetical protein ABFY54_29295 [Priestia megaterium]|uniref:hypothetical protein n=1 Tax=Priestia megaterium TaxID=1404 RepID=UPI003D2C8AA2